MGEAKRRGTREERVKSAIEKGPRKKNLSARERRKFIAAGMENLFYALPMIIQTTRRRRTERG